MNVGGSAKVVCVHKGGQPNAHSMHTRGEGGSKKGENLHTYYVHSPLRRGHGYPTKFTVPYVFPVCNLP